MKGRGMLVVSLRGVNYRFLFQLECSGESAKSLAVEVFFAVAHAEIKKRRHSVLTVSIEFRHKKRQVSPNVHDSLVVSFLPGTVCSCFYFVLSRQRVFGAEPCLLVASWTGYYPRIWLVTSVSLIWSDLIDLTTNSFTIKYCFYVPLEIEMSIAQGLVKRLEKEGYIRSTLKGKR